MKEHGHYHTVMQYLLPPGRSKENLLDDINDKNYTTHFAGLLSFINLLGPTYKKYGYEDWSKRIKTAHEDWTTECHDKYGEYFYTI